MRRTRQASDAEIKAAINGHAGRLADTDPNRAINYRSDMHQQAASEWPKEASHDLGLEISKTWAPSAATDEYWGRLPAVVRKSYADQGALVIQAVAAAFDSKS